MTGSRLAALLDRAERERPGLGPPTREETLARFFIRDNAVDMARLLVDDRPVVEWAASVACLEPNEDGVSVCGGTCVTCVARALLAVFTALDEKAGGA